MAGQGMSGFPVTRTGIFRGLNGRRVLTSCAGSGSIEKEVQTTLIASPGDKQKLVLHETMKLKQQLAGYLSEKELASLVGGFDVVGDIAIIIVPKNLVCHEKRIAEAVLESNRRIRVVAKRDGIYGGEYRTIPLKILAGEQRKETEVREFGIRLLLNPESVYYSVRSGGERRRIASLVEDDETVMVFFSGVAPFPLIISRHSGAKCIVGIEKNPLAHAYGKQNLRRNRTQQNIRLLLGDVKRVVPNLSMLFDRVIMPLPGGAERFLPTALNILRPGGWLHFYDLQSKGQAHHSIDKIVGACRTTQRSMVSQRITRCGHCAPRTYRICVDARIQ
ncbi:MAG: class I SAM-dependent methyltransferase [Desulforhopalus sp.]